jgi:acetylglutamate/LysW-gamma-L-alpha-aminoadipate kinase
VAGALPAETLLLLSNVPGLLRRFPDERSLIRSIRRSDLELFMGYAQGRMKRKLLGAGEALEGGVGQVILGDGRLDAPVSQALSGKGTVIR